MTGAVHTPGPDPTLVMIGQLLIALENLTNAAAATPGFASPMFLRDAQELLARIECGAA